ncbi:MAG: DEAD/DEAH box helicase [Chitinispirillales bacterium]|jgi:DNA excision repair protein ERCC-3|nr:DEAD/DEAH box helicase [Chitinispirillales bacterium]
MTYNPNNPLIIQSDGTILLEVNNPKFTCARDLLSSFAHLEKSPEHVHSYSITPLSLWNAKAIGLVADNIISALEDYTKYTIPANVIKDIKDISERFGKINMVKFSDGRLSLESDDKDLLSQLVKNPSIIDIVEIDGDTVIVEPKFRGILKQKFIDLNFPVNDIAGFVDGEDYNIKMLEIGKDNIPFVLRNYQKSAVDSFIGNDNLRGTSGVVVLPCGAGKTIVGIKTMEKISKKTLILVTNITAAHQWKREILNRTNLNEDEIGEYSGEQKEIKPITIATYQILTYRRDKEEDFMHFGIFNSQDWGLIIYDEVHLLPAPVFKFTAEIQARRRLGLTATLIREDNLQTNVFALIGPKKFDVPWKDLEKDGWIATAKCVEIRVDLDEYSKIGFLSLTKREQVRVAYENKNKISVVADLLKKHKGEKILILGQYINQIDEHGKKFNAPVIKGNMKNSERDALYEKFRNGDLNVLVLSRVGNMAVDLPDANVAIQISGMFGSRQEEAQRLGRILRPKRNSSQAIFYSVVTRDTVELEFAMKRQIFLAEQGYPYEIVYM